MFLTRNTQSFRATAGGRAQQFSTDMNDLAKLNGMSIDFIIYSNEKLTIK
ncbi:LysM peptidoglycan-binding domain-containing protein [Lactobacillus sp. CBA3605]